MTNEPVNFASPLLFMACERLGEYFFQLSEFFYCVFVFWLYNIHSFSRYDIFVGHIFIAFCLRGGKV